MIKIVLDTYVLISALIGTGKTRKLIFEVVRGKAQLILSRSIDRSVLEKSSRAQSIEQKLQPSTAAKCQGSFQETPISLNRNESPFALTLACSSASAVTRLVAVSCARMT